MTLSAFDLVRGVFALDPSVFSALERQDAPLRLALGVVFLAGLSTALGQSVVLFAARVKPRRFAASLLLQAAIFVGAYLFWTLSIWLLATTVYDVVEPYRSTLAAVGLAYAPQLLGFFVLVPYLGSFIGVALSIWNLLAITVAGTVVFGLELPQSLLCSAGGWLLLQLAQRTIGWPVGRLTRWLRGAVAGASLERLDELLRRGRDGVRAGDEAEKTLERAAGTLSERDEDAEKAPSEEPG